MGVRLPEGHVLEANNVGLVVFDALERARADFESSGAIETIARLLAACRSAGVPVFYARADHRDDGRDFEHCRGDADSSFRRWSDEHPAPTRPPHSAGSPPLGVLPELAPMAGDYDIPKHRWSAFHGTCLELSLRARGIDTVLLVGGSTHVGIAATAFAGRDLDFHMVIVADACTGLEEQRAFFLERVFPRMCHVLTVEEVVAALVS
ncbi:MAG: cysteine hydrolase family protein [Thermoleophilia bacterium]